MTESAVHVHDIMRLHERLNTVEEHLRAAADQLQHILHLYTEIQRDLDATMKATAVLRRQFDTQFPERWNCPHCSRSLNAPADPTVASTCPFCGKAGRP